MPLSRLRLRLTRSFAVAFLVGLLALDSFAYGWFTARAGHDFNERLKEAAAGAQKELRREASGKGGMAKVVATVDEALSDWSPANLGFVVYNRSGARIASGGDEVVLQRIPPLDSLPDVGDIGHETLSNGRRLRYVADTAAGEWLVAAASTDVLRRQRIDVLLRILITMPVALLLALTVGYVQSRYALEPIAQLGAATAAISPGPLSGRLPVHAQPDELDRLATQFNALLNRIDALQAQSRRFLREAAHQIRTPLTLVLGEAELALERDRTPEEYVRVLRRIQAAAGQMTHRVSDLVLLARMEAGERPPLRDQVELDAVALEATDLFRGRAQVLGHRLELRQVEPCVLTGDEGLLREALLELLENACRHGTTAIPVGVAIRSEGTTVVMEVCSGGKPIVLVPEPPVGEPPRELSRGIGLSIVRWIAEVHAGTLELSHRGAENVVMLRLPGAARLLATSSTAGKRILQQEPHG